MGKVKSAIITTLVVLAVLALSFFAVISITYGSGNKRLNSIVSSISLGAEFTGTAETVIYPEGVVSEAQYQLYLPETGDEDYDDYVNKYTKVGSLYVEKDADENLKAQVAADAQVINNRLSKMEYSSYSVTVLDGYAIKISVATGYSYSDYVHSDYVYDDNGSTTKLSNISSVLSALTLDGELSLRNSSVGYSYDKYDTGVNSLFGIKTDVTSLIKSVSAYSSGGTYAVKIKLTSDGETAIADATAKMIDADSTSLLFYVGASQLLSLTVEEAIDESSFYITVSDEATAKAYASILDSVANGETISLEYNSENADGLTVAAAVSPYGRATAIAAGATVLGLLVILCAVSIIKYKKLGLVNALILLIYSLVMIYSVFLLELEITFAAIFFAMLGMGVLTFTNFKAFEDARYFVKHGNVMRNAIKQGYKKSLLTIIDLHVVLIVVSLMVALIAQGVAATCGFIFFIASIASYVLYWFTRFMWYVLSSPVKDKFKFCGFKREVLDDDD